MAFSINTISTLLTVLFNLYSSQLDFSVLQESQEPRPWNGNVRMTWTIHMARNWPFNYWDQLMDHSVLAEHATEVVNNKTMKCREVNVGCLVSRWIQPCFKILKCKMYIETCSLQSLRGNRSLCVEWTFTWNPFFVVQFHTQARIQC